VRSGPDRIDLTAQLVDLHRSGVFSEVSSLAAKQLLIHDAGAPN
jgi:hypothetical protein